MTMPGDELPESEDRVRYRARAFTLADGTVTVYLPREWELTREDFSSAEFSIPWIDGATLFMKAKSYEAPEPIATNDIAHFLGGRDLPLPEPLAFREDGSVAWERQTVRHTGWAAREKLDAPREAFWLWRRIGLLRPTYVRTLEVHLYVPAEDARHKRAAEAAHFLSSILPETVFADRQTLADRVAPSETLRQDWFWDTICLRVPADWPDAERENPDGTGMFVFDDKEADRWTLWIDFHSVAHRGGRSMNESFPALETVEDLAREARRDRDIQHVEVFPMADRPNEAAMRVEFEHEENGALYRDMSWQKVMNHGTALVIGQFCWVVRKSAVNDPDIVALTALIEREVLDSTSIDPKAYRLNRDPVGRA